ncbi:hypothetical protein PSET11_00179 [Arthrobacter ulcerisalmonis]|uniref:SipW-cognate class signal peptide n=1 Tax=Arthrobacter ulcerisalmonis TaxID=2483813 RepID=A0A3P5WQV0_9MICC|nr:SipW-dependent-type signal peptide-containing protein [Arthrobacter ulcerisalmonis]VDC18313.1 hypothetical protein PSET11_00179 [Arthrobacter ulcerisalmonis]
MGKRSAISAPGSGPSDGEQPAVRSRPRRRRRGTIRAILAGGLVLISGGAMTLAAWTDQEVAQATFSSSTFRLQSTIDGGTNWADSTEASPATLAFSAAGMSPNTILYASIGIRTTTGSLSGSLTLGAGQLPSGPPALAGVLKYRAVVATAATCDVTSFGGTPTFLVGGAALKQPLTTAGTGTVPIGANSTAPRWVCFEVSMDANADNSLQGQAAMAVKWTITGTSSS